MFSFTQALSIEEIGRSLEELEQNKTEWKYIF